MEDIEESQFVALDHDQLIKAVSKLDKTQHITEPTRNEPTNLNSEFNLIKRTNKFNINKVVKILEDTANHVQISRKLKKSHDASKVLRKPLEKPQAERIKRATGYEETKKVVGRWDPVVARSRTLDYVSFPLKHISTKLQPTNEFLSKLKMKSSLEKELDEVDPPVVVADEEDEEEQVYPMSYEEMVEHRQHLAKIRAQQSYKAAKAKRQNKIKSKKFHRVLKKEKLKQQLKEFEELQKKNPEEALKKLEALEKSRALERHTLRHKNTGKWAKNKMIRAKYDKEVRQQLAEQLAVSRSLTHKTQDVDSTDDETGDNEIIPDIALSQDPMNPWMMKQSDKSNINAEFDFGYKKYVKDKILKHQDESDSDSSNDQIMENTNDNNETQMSILNTLKESVSKLSQNNENDDFKNVLNTEPTKLKTKGNTKLRKLKPVATSNWAVEPIINIETTVKPTADISTAFETFKSGIAGQVEKKLVKMRKHIDRLEKLSKSSHKDKKEKNKGKSQTDNLEYLKLKNQKKKAIIDEELIETGSKTVQEQNENKSISKTLDIVQNPSFNLESIDSNIDPSRFIEVKPKYLNTALPKDVNESDLLDDDDEQVVPKVNIEEVFEEDDVVASFRQEKEDEVNKDKPEDIDLRLPGWGSWGGISIKVPKRRRNRFILKTPPKIPRRDENKGDIIIKEYNDPKLAAHRVTDVPFPFTSVKEYEASIRTPLGNTFIPEKAHKKLIRPSVITKSGTIIEPMDEDELLHRKNRIFKNEAVIKVLGKK